MTKPDSLRRVIASTFLAAFLSSTSLGSTFLGFGPVWAADQGELGKALEYLDKGEVRTAVIVLKQMLQADPESADARLLLGKTYLKLGLGAGAEKELRWARRLGIEDDLIRYPLGESILQQGDYGRVFEEIKMGTDMAARQQAEVLTLQGLARLSENKASEAEDLLIKARRVDPSFIDALVGMVRVRIAQKRHIAAEDLLSEALETDPRCADCWSLRGELKRLDGKYEEAVEYYTSASDIDPANFSAQLGLAATNIELNNLDAASEALDKVEEVRPAHPLRNYLNGVIAFQARDLETAQTEVAEALKTMPDHLPSIMLNGSVSFAAGNMSAAIESLTNYLRAIPGHVPARKVLAAAYLRTGEVDLAIEALRPVIQNRPDDAQAMALFGSAYFQKGDFKNGELWLAKALEKAPDAEAVRTQLAMTQMAGGNTDKAIEALRDLSAGKQELGQADVLLILALLEKRDFKGAMDAADALAEKSPDAVVPRNLKGVALLGLEEKAAARAEFEAIVSAEPEFTPARLNLVKLDMTEQSWDQARAGIDAILEYAPNNASALMHLAAIEARQGNADAAVDVLKGAWRENPGAVGPGLELIRVYIGSGQADEALNIARTLYDAQPDEPRIARALAAAQMTAKQFSSAVITLKRLEKARGTTEDTQFMLATALAASDNMAEAEQVTRTLLNNNPNLLKASRLMVRIQMARKQDEDALNTARAVQRRFPKDASGFQMEAEIRLARKEDRLAALAYRKAFEVAPSAGLAIVTHRALHAINDPQASEPLDAWLASNPDDVGVRLAKAIHLRGDGELRAAIEAYEGVLALAPDNIQALNNLAIAYEELNDPRAIDMAERAYEVGGARSPAVADTLGWMLVRKGDAGRAVGILEQALVKAPNVPVLRYHYAAALAKTGAVDKALRELEKLKVRDQKFDGKDEADALYRQLSQ
ncbi:MAG: XrtA/PEP-CTERM system TPR-repeat protein PrsT [Gammaproteobacteria bacterium]